MIHLRVTKLIHRKLIDLLVAPRGGVSYFSFLISIYLYGYLRGWRGGDINVWFSL